MRKYVPDGTCPFCGSENVTVNDSCVEDNSYIEEWRCDDCDESFIAYYNLIYDETVDRHNRTIEVEDENGEED